MQVFERVQRAKQGSVLQSAGYIDSRRGAASVVVWVRGGMQLASPPRLRAVDDAAEWIEVRCKVEPQVVAIAALDAEPLALSAAREVVAGGACRPCVRHVERRYALQVPTK